MKKVAILIGMSLLGSHREAMAHAVRASAAIELAPQNDKDSHRGPKVRGKGKKAYRGSL